MERGMISAMEFAIENKSKWVDKKWLEGIRW